MEFNKELLKGYTDSLILSVLLKQDMYGFQLVKEINQITDNLYEMKEGTLYPVLKRMEKNNFITGYWEDSDKGGRRKYYKVTDDGLTFFKEKSQEWSQFKKMIDRFLGGV